MPLRRRQNYKSFQLLDSSLPLDQAIPSQPEDCQNPQQTSNVSTKRRRTDDEEGQLARLSLPQDEDNNLIAGNDVVRLVVYETERNYINFV